jgi:hypothetical protein
MRVRIHEVLEHIVARDLVDALQYALVALLEHVARFRPGLVRQHQRQRVVLDPPPPQVVLAGLGGEPRRLGAVEGEGLVEVEVRFRVEVGDRALDRGPVAFLEAREDHECGIDVAGADRLAELEAEPLEVGNVALQEVAAARVQRLDVAVEHLRGHLLVEHRLAVVRALDHLADQSRHLAVPLRRLQLGARDVGRRYRRRAVRGRASEQQAGDGQQRQDQREACAEAVAPPAGCIRVVCHGEVRLAAGAGSPARSASRFRSISWA